MSAGTQLDQVSFVRSTVSHLSYYVKFIRWATEHKAFLEKCKSVSLKLGNKPLIFIHSYIFVHRKADVECSFIEWLNKTLKSSTALSAVYPISSRFLCTYLFLPHLKLLYGP